MCVNINLRYLYSKQKKLHISFIAGIIITDINSICTFKPNFSHIIFFFQILNLFDNASKSYFGVGVYDIYQIYSIVPRAMY